MPRGHSKKSWAVSNDLFGSNSSSIVAEEVQVPDAFGMDFFPLVFIAAVYR